MNDLSAMASLNNGLVLAAGLNLRPESWPLWVQLVLVCFAAGVGAFIAAQFLVTSRKAVFVGIVAMVAGGASAYLIFRPPLPKVPEVEKVAKSLKPEPSPAHTANKAALRQAQGGEQGRTAAAPKPAAAAKKTVRIERDEAKKVFLVDNEPVTLANLLERLKKLKELHAQAGGVTVVLGERLCHSLQHRKDVEKVFKDLDISFKEESAAKTK